MLSSVDTSGGFFGNATPTTSNLREFERNVTILPSSAMLQDPSLVELRHVHNTTNTTYLGRDEALARLEVIVQSVILGLAITGNSCVLTALARRGKAGSRMHLFIFHLSIADLLVAIFNILPQLIWDITGTFYGGDALCRYIKFMQVYVMYLSTYMLVMTAVDRYRAVCHPLSAFNSSSRVTLYIMIFSAYVISGILSVPQPIIFKYQETEVGTGAYDCWVNFDPPWTLDLYITSFTVAVYIVPLVILAFAYISICYTIRKKHNSAKNERSSLANGQDSLTTNQNVYSHHVASKMVFRNRGIIERRPNVIRRQRPPPSSVPRNHTMRGFSRAKMKTVKLTFVVILAYLVCWSPFFVSQLWWLYDEAQENNDAVVIMILLGSLNSCCNPWIYMAFSGSLIRHVCPPGYRRRQKSCCCSLKKCRYRQHHRRRNSTNNNDLDLRCRRRETDVEQMNHIRDGGRPEVELRELIVDGSNRKRQIFKSSSPDTAGFTVTSKTLITKTGCPQNSQQCWKKDTLHKRAILQNGRPARDVDWTHPLANNDGVR